jgi:hypothetical protein
MKIKKEYIILLAVIFALSLYLSLRRSDRLGYELPRLPAVAKTDISKIEIVKTGAAVELNKQNDNWNIGLQEYPADAAKIKDMLGIVEDLALTAMVSESGDYSRYELDDEHKISVKAWSGESIKREFDIGKAAPSYRHTFVRLKGNDCVYHARENFRHTFDLGVEDLRDKQVLSFDTADIQEIQITKSGRSLACTRLAAPGPADQGPSGPSSSPTEGVVWENAEAGKCDTAKLNRMLATLSNLRCESYIDAPKKEDLSNPMCRIGLKGQKDYHLSIFATTEGDQKGYPAVSSENNYPFLLSEGTANALMKAPEEMLEEPNEKENQGKKGE